MGRVLSQSKRPGLFWMGESSAYAINLKAEQELFPKKKEKLSHFFFHKTSKRAVCSKKE